MSTDHPAPEAGRRPTPRASDPSSVVERSTAPSRPSAPVASDPIERDLAFGALKAIAVLAPPILLVAWLLAGTGGLLGAGVGTAVVAGMYLLSGVLLSYAAPFGPGALMAAALGGFALRLMIYALLIVLLRPVEAIHGPSLAITAAVLLVLTLVWEARLVSRTPNLMWVDAAAARPRPLGVDEPASPQAPTPAHPAHEMTRNPA